MTEATLTRVLAPTADTICEVTRPEGKAAELLEAGLAPRAYLDVLVDAGEVHEAIRFLTHGLPIREAIWWALCSARVAHPEPNEAIARALEITEAWVMTPDEGFRRSAKEIAEAAGYDTPAGCVALAVYYSGGSLAGEDGPEIPPDENLAARVASGSLLLSTVADPENAVESARSVLDVGVEISNSRCPWEG